MPKMILIVEDYVDSREFLKFLLESFGYEVLEAGDGMEAVESINRHLPDLILMDISMPRMDGLTATRIIRETQDKNKMPIIAITAHGKNYYKKAMEAGCNDLIDKPIDFEIFEPLLNQYLEA